MMNLSPDVAAYLAQAVQIVADDLGFKPQSEAELKYWLAQNMPLIAQTASHLQRQLYEKLFERSDQVFEAASTAMAARVWHRCRTPIAPTQEKWRT